MVAYTWTVDPASIPLPDPASEVYFNTDIMLEIVSYLGPHRLTNLRLAYSIRGGGLMAPEIHRNIRLRDPKGGVVDDIPYTYHDRLEYAYLYKVAQPTISCAESQDPTRHAAYTRRLFHVLHRPFPGTLKVIILFKPGPDRTFIDKVDIVVRPRVIDPDAAHPRITLRRCATFYWTVDPTDCVGPAYQQRLEAVRAEMQSICGGLHNVEIRHNFKLKVPRATLKSIAPTPADENKVLEFMRKLYGQPRAVQWHLMHRHTGWERHAESVVRLVTGVKLYLQAIVHDSFNRKAMNRKAIKRKAIGRGR